MVKYISNWKKEKGPTYTKCIPHRRLNLLCKLPSLIPTKGHLR